MSNYNPFYDDLKARKAPAYSASHKKNGSKSRKCSLPSDNLTPAQKRKLNGTMHEWNVKETMSWEIFKLMPIDLQQEHLDYISQRFNLGHSTVSKSVFGKSKDCLWRHAAKYGLTLNKSRGARIPKDIEAELDAWLNGKSYVPATEEPVIEEAPVTEEPVIENEPAPAPEVRSAPAKFNVKHLTADISGSAEALVLYLSAMLGGRDADVRVEINFKGE